MKSKTKIGLGTVQFGLPYGISNTTGQVSAQEVKKILNLARKEGIGVLDSASAYGNAEEVLGNNSLQEFEIVSKFMPPSVGGKISDQLDQSLEKLQLDFLYGYLAHRPIKILEFPEQWIELEKLKEAGKIKKIGFSLNTPEELEILLKRNYIPDLVQVPYNYFDRRFEDLAKELKRKGCEVHARSAFLQGLFFVKPVDLDDYFDEIKPLLQKLQKEKESLPGKLLKFILEKPFIDKVILGVQSEQQLIENLDGLKDSSGLPELKNKIPNKILIPSEWPK